MHHLVTREILAKRVVSLMKPATMRLSTRRFFPLLCVLKGVPAEGRARKADGNPMESFRAHQDLRKVFKSVCTRRGGGKKRRGAFVSAAKGQKPRSASPRRLVFQLGYKITVRYYTDLDHGMGRQISKLTMVAAMSDCLCVPALKK